MKGQAKISINNPCSEKWDEMIPQEKGKLCLRCDRIITDFTNKTDQEILDYIKASKGQICGRFKDEQLNRELEFNNVPKIIPIWQKVAASLLFFIGVENTHAARFSSDLLNYDYSISKSDTDKNISKEKKAELKIKGDAIIVKGKIVDERTKEGLPFATVILEELKIVAHSDFDGYFTFTLPKNITYLSSKAKIVLIGYETTIQRIVIDTKIKNNTENYYSLKSIGIKSEQKTFMGDLVIVEYKKKWWQFWK